MTNSTVDEHEDRAYEHFSEVKGFSYAAHWLAAGLDRVERAGGAEIAGSGKKGAIKEQDDRALHPSIISGC